MEKAAEPSPAGSPGGSSPSFGKIVLKQTVRVTLFAAIGSTLIFGLVISPITMLAPLNNSTETGFARWFYAFLACAQYGFVLGALVGFVSGLVSGLTRAYKSRRVPPAQQETPASEPPSSSTAGG